MMRKAFLLLLILGTVYCDVNTTIGVVRGITTEGDDVIRYLGIPYAEPAEGDLRFKPPVKKARMEGIYVANSNTKICPQPYVFPWPYAKEQTEDCLRLDIYQPTVANKDNLLPVMIWIYGGAYLLGDSATYNPSYLATKGEVIVVAMNYRIGILGFLNTMDNNAVGDFGLRDQCLAIEWVSENIGAFGGNASQVTIFGESAGASSASQLSMSPLCSDKFQRVITQSGAATMTWANNPNPKQAALQLAADAGCPSDSDGLVFCLRNKTIEEINDLTLLGAKSSLADFVWVPSFSPDIFPDNPFDILSGKDSPGLRRFRSKDLLTGLCFSEGEVDFLFNISGSENLITVNVNDTGAILTQDEFDGRLKKFAARFWGLDAYELDKLFPLIRFQYTDWKNRNDVYANTREMIEFTGDFLFNLASIKTANVHADDTKSSSASVTGSTYFYQFVPKASWLSSRPWTVGSNHGEDLRFTRILGLFFNGTALEKTLSDQIIRYLSNFAKTGSPNDPTSVTLTWPEYDKDLGQYMELNTPSTIQAFPFSRRVAFWEILFDNKLSEVRKEREISEKRCNKGINSCSGPESFILTYVIGILSIFTVIFLLNRHINL